MGLVYIEYISRLPGIDLETFRAQAAQGQEGWDSGYEDELVLSLGRTWRLGPDPGYMTVWHTRNAGLDRIDAWDRIFRSGEADDLEQPFFQVARIDVAGCYDPLLEPVPARNGTYYAEFFAAHDTADAVRSFYESRAKQHPEFTLNLLVQRIGKLAPNPAVLPSGPSPTSQRWIPWQPSWTESTLRSGLPPQGPMPTSAGRSCEGRAVANLRISSALAAVEAPAV